MTIAIKRSNGDLLWFDAVLQFSRRLGGSVSKHPLETGAVITDHTTIDNEVMTLSGVVSDADFNLNRPTISSQQAKLYDVTNKQFMNNTPVTSVDGTGGVIYNNVIITETDDLTRFLPESVGQFFGTASPKVELNPQTPPEKVMPALAVQGYLVSMFNQRESFVLLSFIDDRIDEAFENCVMTSLEFTEDPDSGDAVYPVMTIERVKYATSTYVKIQTRVSADMEKKATPEKNNGKQGGDGTVKEDEALDPEKPQTNTTQTSGSVVKTTVEGRP